MDEKEEELKERHWGVLEGVEKVPYLPDSPCFGCGFVEPSRKAFQAFLRRSASPRRKPGASADGKDFFNTLIFEDMDSKLDILVEGQMALDAKIDRHYGEFREFASDTKFKFGIVFEKFNEVDDKFGVVFERFKEIDDKFEIVFEELHELRKERVR